MTPQQNTKIERLVEALESFGIAIAQGILSAERVDILSQRKTPQAIASDRADARKEIRDALAEFLTPSMRIVEKIETVGNARQELRVATMTGIGHDK